MKKAQTHEIEIDVPAEAAWRALTDPDELVRMVQRGSPRRAAGGRALLDLVGKGRDGREPDRRLGARRAAARRATDP